MPDQTVEVELNEVTSHLSDWLANDQRLYSWILSTARRAFALSSTAERAIEKLARETKSYIEEEWNEPNPDDNSWVYVLKVQHKLDIAEVQWEALVEPWITELLEENE